MPSVPTDTDGEAATEERRLRLRVLLAEYRTLLVVALVVALALGGWVSYGAYATPGEETTRERDRVWTATGSFSHGATVTESNPVYPAGTRLENESLYYTAVTPTVDGEFVGGYESRTAADVRVRLTVDVVYRAVDGESDAVYWSKRERLAATTVEDASPGETVSAAFSLNVTDAAAAIDEIERELGASPGETEIALELEREIDGTIAGEERSAADGYRVEIATDHGTYRLDERASYDEHHEESDTETVPTSAGPARTVGGPLLVLIGVGGLAGLAVVSRRVPEPTTAERAWLAYRDDADRFADVITTVALPDAALEGPRAELETLAELAAFGIDVGAAVVFDPERGLYAVREDGLVYVFEPPRRRSTEAGDRISDSDAPGRSPVTDERATASAGADPTGAVDDDLLALAGFAEDRLESGSMGGDSRSDDGPRPTETDTGRSDGGDRSRESPAS
ncbi:DUF5305 domain-containing protein [Natrinema salaciae]|uniref:DUF5305 domain-containing protein n=1 Tax=Natrinema salaciae TaxID=1186196 RepID=A0A1H9M9D8_9EURY|nr:DUF5305 domain-containing protein [Natrinema salaciae]SER20294.1 hypothetical protein SAMN04489841_3265 [Natrinema salaciae]